MALEDLFDDVPDPGAYSVPDYSIPKGEPVMPIAITRDELSTLLELYETFAAVDPTGIESNPFLNATSEFLQRTFAMPLERPDERLHDDIAALLNDFSDDLAGREIGVVDATPAHHRTLYAFLTTSRGYYATPHVRFDPDEDAVEVLYRVYERVVEQDPYLKRPETVLE
ncbi:hypothetical protein [Natrialbaceae archaeon AArc-T1-2]|uniref:hypothetical protein n=1 Tax=Natrialbaceae archaeon AArc-T1-2 TaxID=3053904 RepID=UPI00255AF016|nr:hypothetical protein [Natrialbaceae archaeon AArc-T1-2]WIV67704.1 hypothetical protein QQ977_02940 [Natrialbaceae archaeon AArc-T1-2]